MVTSDEWWNGLPKGIRSQLGQIIKEVTVLRNREAYGVNQANKRKILESGGKIRTLTAAQRLEWVKALKPVWKKFERDVGADMINAAQAANAGS